MSESVLFEALRDFENEKIVLNIIKSVKIKGDLRLLSIAVKNLIENAIKYGIKPFEDSGKLMIRANCEGDAVVISVSDSGFGLTAEETEEINMTINKQIIKESDHIGLSNVNQRINLMFGPQYGVRVKSKIGDGTNVELRIPRS